ncbi:MAG: glycogen/starch synthase [Candidatus Methylacidiphilales bacterium]
MNVLFAASELAPYVKTGGLGDVLGALPEALRERGHSVSVAAPLYAGLRETLPNLTRSKVALKVPFGGRDLPGRVWVGTTETGVRVFALERDEFFDRRHLYGSSEAEYFDNAARFGWFSRAVTRLVRFVDPLPEILHLNDWQTGLAAVWAREMVRGPRVVFTIHNLAYQGVFAREEAEALGVGAHHFSPDGIEFYGRVNFLKAGIVYAHQVTTVSPSYARAIQTPEFGCGLDGVLRQVSGCLTGILNGIDTTVWNPEDNPRLAGHFSVKSLQGKKVCKQDLLRACGWTNRPEAPIFGCVSRLVGAKGFDLILAAAPLLRERGARLVVLGTGEPRLEEAFRDLAERYPEDVAVRIEFSEAWAHRIEAGADFFLMPSEMEPCGLNQMYSQRYGTPPIVHGAGGLADSVEPWDPETGKGTGFVFKPFQTGAFHAEIERALSVFERPIELKRLRKNAMNQDYSWEARVPEYEAVYARALRD